MYKWFSDWNLNLFLKIIKAKIKEEVGSFECGSFSKIGFDENTMHLEIPEDDTGNWKMNGLNQLKVCYEYFHSNNWFLS